MVGALGGGARPMTESRLNLDVPIDQFREIEKQIASDASPVGIDAKKTHVMILHKLLEIERRLDVLEEK